MVAKRKRATGAPTKYKWDKWLDGRKHTLIEGTHFTCTPRSMVVWTYTVARKYGKRVSINKLIPLLDGDGVEWTRLSVQVVKE